MKSTNPPTPAATQVRTSTALRLPPQDVEAEKSLLGGLLLDNKYLVDTLEMLRGDMFYREVHGVIFEAMRSLHELSEPVDVVTVRDAAKEIGETWTGQEFGVYLLGLAEFVPSAASSLHYASIICEKWKLRQVIELSSSAAGSAFALEDSGGIISEVQQQLVSIASVGQRGQWKDIKTLLRTYTDDLEERYHGGGNAKVIPTGFVDIDRFYGGFKKSELTIIAARSSMGKAQPLDSVVRMADGTEKRMGDIEIGDKIASIDGQPSVVTGVFPQGKKQVYRITFCDGRTADACGEHLWQCYYKEWDKAKGRVITTDYIIEKLKYKRYQKSLYVPIHNGSFGEEKELPIHPYLLGALIGDGCLKSHGVMFSSNDPFVISRVTALCAEIGVGVAFRGKYDYSLTTAKGKKNPLLDALKELGLAGKLSIEKEIPPIYMTASREQRLELLRGLMDTDGTVEFRVAAFSTSSPVLAKQVCRLARGLGGVCRIAKKEAWYTKGGVRHTANASYRMRIRHRDGASLFNMPRHKEKFDGIHQRCSNLKLSIAKVEAAGIEECQCISVSHSRSLYITDNDVLTHNTSLAMQMAVNQASLGYSVAVFSLEMSAESLMNRMVSCLASVPSTSLDNGRLSDEQWSAVQVAGGKLWDLPLSIEDESDLTIMQIESKVRELHVKGGLDAVYIDYLTLIRLEGKSSDNRSQQVGDAAKALKNMAKKYDIAMQCLSQLSRGLESRDDKRPRMSDLRDSGNIEEHTDKAIFIYRPMYYARKGEAGDVETNGTEPEEAEIIFGKNRNGAQGMVKLEFTPAYTRFGNVVNGEF